MELHIENTVYDLNVNIQDIEALNAQKGTLLELWAFLDLSLI
jgi:hypothetical protein